MISVGETLRRERLRAGLDLEKIAQDTKISVRTLELIESDQFEKLPGGVFARSFVRQYARAVGLDEGEVVGELEKTLATSADPLPLKQDYSRVPEIRVPRVAQWGGGESRLGSNSWLPSLGMVVLVLVACSAAYTWWQKRGRPPVAPATVETAQSAKPAASEPPQAAAVPAQSAPAAQTQTPETTPQDIAGTSTAQGSTGSLHIALKAEEPTWVRATASGKVVFTGVIQPNETKDLSAPDTVTLRIGNAGGLSITLNGKAIPAVGPKGQVRVVQLSPDGAVQIAPPAKPEPAETPQATQTL
jgi:cytoskeleton protein RodZ